MKTWKGDWIEDNIGAAFPASPVDGMHWMHTGHAMSYRYFQSLSGWLSEATFNLFGGDLIAVGAGVFLIGPGGVRGTSTLGAGWNFALKCVGMLVNAGAASTATVAVIAGATPVTGASLSLAASTRALNDVSMLSNTIAAGAVLNLGVTSGLALTSIMARATFRRFEV